jgi:hypothetical protein
MSYMRLALQPRGQGTVAMAVVDTGGYEQLLMAESSKCRERA